MLQGEAVLTCFVGYRLMNRRLKPLWRFHVVVGVKRDAAATWLSLLVIVCLLVQPASTRSYNYDILAKFINIKELTNRSDL